MRLVMPKHDNPQESAAAALATRPLAREALRIIEQEAASLARLVRDLDVEELERTLDLLIDCKGKVVVIGSGKSGMAARKIASTLTSTGTVAVFLHPVDALHGDIGIVAADDVAIAVSNSGETDEMKAVVSHLKRRKAVLVAIVGDQRSTLARHADVVLLAPVDKEAGSLNLAPTTSTLAAMAIGDALAMCVMNAKGFGAEDFALLHPGGTLGKRLTLRVCDLMHEGEDNPTLLPHCTFAEVLQGITRGGLGAVNIVDAEGALLGLITDGDVRRAFQYHGLEAMKSLVARDAMTSDPVSVTPETLAVDALKVMEDRASQISVLPVVDRGTKCVGLLRLHDIVRAGLR